MTEITNPLKRISVDLCGIGYLTLLYHFPGGGKALRECAAATAQQDFGEMPLVTDDTQQKET